MGSHSGLAVRSGAPHARCDSFADHDRCEMGVRPAIERHHGSVRHAEAREKYTIDHTRSSESGQSHRTLREQAIYNICLRSLRVETLAALRSARIATGDLF